MQRKPKLLSLFDGSGGFPLAGTLCGITPTIASEVEPYPIAVTTSRFPNMKHLGSVTDIHGAEIEPVDIITFGSPCQDLSVAGKRAGLKHEANGDEETTRSGLFMEAVRIIKEMRRETNGVYPNYAIWENVPGAFSSNRGEDFRVVLEELIKIIEPGATVPSPEKGKWPYADAYVGDGWSLAYRTLDAQYWGVPQRRRRIYLVVDFRGERAQKILFERQGLRGYFEKGRAPWQGTAGNAENCPGADDSQSQMGERGSNRGGDGCCRGGNCVAYGVTTKGNGDAFVSEERHTALSAGGGQPGQGYPCTMVAFAQNKRDEVRDLNGVTGALAAEPGMKQQTFICMATQQGGAEVRTDNKAPTITAAAGMSGNNQPVVCYPNVTDQNILDDQGGSQIGVRTDGKAPTLRAEMHGNVPCVLDAAGFKPGQGAKAMGLGYEKECAPTLLAGQEPGVVYAIENHPADSRVDIDESGKVQTLTSRMGTGGGNVPMVMEQQVYESHPMDSRIKELDETAPTVSRKWHKGAADTPLVCQKFCKQPIYCLQGNGIDRADTAGCNGKGVKEDICYTLNTIDRPAVAYSLETFHCTSEEEKTTTLKARDYKDPVCVAFAYGFDQGATRDVGKLFLEEQSKTLTNGTCPGHHNGVVVAGIDCRNMNESPELYPTLQAKPNGGQSLNFSHAVRTQYIVRRLTPTECARLQGFPDKWGHINHKEDFTDEEYKFWLNVRNTHAAINGKTTKEYTKPQMLTWYNKLHTDSAEYKMWGNGIALPTALYVMQGIAAELEKEGGDTA